MNPYINNICDHYQESNVTHTSPEGLIALLYTEWLRCLVMSKEAFLRNDLTDQNKNISKSIEILAELIGSLNMEKGEQVSTSFALLYEYIVKKLFLLRQQPTIELFDEIINLVTPLKEAWGTIAIPKIPLQIVAK